MFYPRLAALALIGATSALIASPATAAPLTYDSCGRPSTSPYFGQVEGGGLGALVCVLAGIGAIGNIGKSDVPPYQGWVPPTPQIDGAARPAPLPEPPPARKDMDTPTR